MSKMKNVISIVILAVLPFIGCIVYFSARTRANVMAFDPANTFGSVRLQLGLCMVILGIFMVLEFFTAKIFCGESWARRLIVNRHSACSSCAGLFLLVSGRLLLQFR